jgi:hypothetical protein
VTKSGAAATFNNRASAEEQANEVEKITGGRFHLVLDATMYGAEAAFAMLKKSSMDNKVFSTVDDM